VSRTVARGLDRILRIRGRSGRAAEHEGQAAAPRAGSQLTTASPLAFFAGIWTPWRGDRGSARNPRRGEHELFGFITCEPNKVFKPIHPKAISVILTDPTEIEIWLAD
jgi:putative SOS response-associated peptidase YedK